MSVRVRKVQGFTMMTHGGNFYMVLTRRETYGPYPSPDDLLIQYRELENGEDADFRDVVDIFVKYADQLSAMGLDVMPEGERERMEIVERGTGFPVFVMEKRGRELYVTYPDATEGKYPLVRSTPRIVFREFLRRLKSSYL